MTRTNSRLIPSIAPKSDPVLLHVRAALLAGSAFLTLITMVTSASANLVESGVTRRDHGCEVRVRDGVAEVDVRQGEGSVIEWPLESVAGPAELSFRLKTTVSGDDAQYIVYWLVAGEREWRSFRRIPFQADGQWHDYRLPLADRGTVVAIRFSFGQQRHRVEIADVRVTSVTLPLPGDLEEERRTLADTVEVVADSLRCQLDCRTQVFTIRDAVTGRVWTSDPISGWMVLYQVERPSAARLSLKLFDLHAARELAATVELKAHREVSFTIETADPQSPMEAASQFPPQFSTEMDAGQIVFCDRSCGVLLSQNDPTYGSWPLRVYGNTHCLDMPWIGLFDHRRGDGMMLLAETSTDAEIALVGDAQGRHWPAIRWLSSMDRFGPGRSASLCFTEGGGYVRMAKLYRERLQRGGRLKTLSEKAAMRPNVLKLRGAPFFWGGESARAFIEEMPTIGISRGVINGCKDPLLVEQLNKQGYLTGRYDSYTDILPGKPGFQRDDVESAAIRPRPGGSPKHGWLLEDGRQMFWRSSAKWLEALQSYVPNEMTRIPYTARFVDVAAAAELFEDYHPQHTMTRQDDLSNRRALFSKLLEYQLVLGTEHGNDWVADQVDYFEGAMSGPFWWSSWPAGYLKRPNRDQLSADYLKFGVGFAHRVPLWELVYHDCAVSTYYWGDTAGMLFQAAPELADRKDLFNILYATSPLIWMDGRDYRYPEDKHRMLRTFHDTCPLHQVLAFEEMTEHEFLDADQAVQRTRFSGGAIVVVNFSDEPRNYNDGEKPITLAPRGFYVRAAGIQQSRLWVNGAPQTVICKGDYLTVAGDGQTFVEGIRSAGRVTTFKVDDNRRNILLEPNQNAELDIRRISGWESSIGCLIYEIKAKGELGDIAASADERGFATLRATDQGWKFAVIQKPRD